MEEFEQQMLETTKFSLGYVEGRQSVKRWICCEDDLNAMYTQPMLLVLEKKYSYGVMVKVMKTAISNVQKARPMIFTF